MACDSDGDGSSRTIVVTCEGDLCEPGFPNRLARLTRSLGTLLSSRDIRVRRVEPWNSVRLTLTLAGDAADRLRQLAAQGSNLLRRLGILSVQLEGDQVICLRMHGVDSDILINTAPNSQDAGNASSSNDNNVVSRLLSGVNANVSSTMSTSGSSSGSNNQPSTSSAGAAVEPSTSTSANHGLSTNQLSEHSKIHFKSPNVVCPTDTQVPKPPQSSSSPLGHPGAQRAYSGPFPFASMTHAAQTIHSRESTSTPLDKTSTQPGSSAPNVTQPIQNRTQTDRIMPQNDRIGVQNDRIGLQNNSIRAQSDVVPQNDVLRRNDISTQGDISSRVALNNRIGPPNPQKSIIGLQNEAPSERIVASNSSIGPQIILGSQTKNDRISQLAPPLIKNDISSHRPIGHPMPQNDRIGHLNEAIRSDISSLTRQNDRIGFQSETSRSLNDISSHVRRPSDISSQRQTPVGEIIRGQDDVLSQISSRDISSQIGRQNDTVRPNERIGLGETIRGQNDISSRQNDRISQIGVSEPVRNQSDISSHGRQIGVSETVRGDISSQVRQNDRISQIGVNEPVRNQSDILSHGRQIGASDISSQVRQNDRIGVSEVIRNQNDNSQVRDISSQVRDISSQRDSSQRDISSQLRDSSQRDISSQLRDSSQRDISQARDISSQARDISSQARDISSQARDISSQPRDNSSRLLPPPPYPNSVAISSPLLVNLLQNDGAPKAPKPLEPLDELIPSAKSAFAQTDYHKLGVNRATGGLKGPGCSAFRPNWQFGGGFAGLQPIAQPMPHLGSLNLLESSLNLPNLTDLSKSDLDDILPSLEPEVNDQQQTTQQNQQQQASTTTTPQPTTLTRSGKPRQYLINPLTGELEPASSSGSSSESESEEAPSPVVPPQTRPDRGVSSDTDSSSSSTSKHEQTDDEDLASELRPRSKNRDRIRDSPSLKKPQPEKIKLRLKLEKSEPINSAYKVDVSFINSPKRALTNLTKQTQKPKNINIQKTATVLTNEELRVPPLHISLRGRNSVVINTEKKRKNREKARKIKEIRDTNVEKNINCEKNKNLVSLSETKELKVTKEQQTKEIKETKEQRETKDVREMALLAGGRVLEDFKVYKRSTGCSATAKAKLKGEMVGVRRGSDSDVVKGLKRHADNGMNFGDKKRRMSQSDSKFCLSDSQGSKNIKLKTDEIMTIGSTNIGTVTHLKTTTRPKSPSTSTKIRRDKITTKTKELNREKTYSQNVAEKLAKQLPLPIGEIDMGAKIKQKLLENSEISRLNVNEIIQTDPLRKENVTETSRNEFKNEITRKENARIEILRKENTRSETEINCVENDISRKEILRKSEISRAQNEILRKENTRSEINCVENDISRAQIEISRENDISCMRKNEISRKNLAQSEISRENARENDISRQEICKNSARNDILQSDSEILNDIQTRSKIISEISHAQDLEKIEKSPHGAQQGEDSGIESMDALSEKSPNQPNQSPNSISENTQKSEILINLTCPKSEQKILAQIKAQLKSEPDEKSEVKDDLEPLPIRLKPALYTYEKNRESPDLNLSDFENSDNERKKSDSDTEKNKKKSLLEQLLIEIPDEKITNKIKTRSTSKLNSPEEKKVKKRKRQESESSTTSLDESRKKARKCSENAVELIKVCMGVDKKQEKIKKEESSDSDEPLIEIAGKARQTRNKINVKTVKIVSRDDKMGTRRSIRNNISNLKTRSKIEKIVPPTGGDPSESLRRKTRSTVSSEDLSRKSIVQRRNSRDSNTNK